VVAHRKRDVDFVGIQSHAAGDERDLVESIGAASPPADPYLEARLLPGNYSAGFDPALIQGVFTPMVAGFGRLYGMPVMSMCRIHFLQVMCSGISWTRRGLGGRSQGDDEHARERIA
jgi:hypothetical protein